MLRYSFPLTSTLPSLINLLHVVYQPRASPQAGVLPSPCLRASIFHMRTENTYLRDTITLTTGYYRVI